MILPKPISTRRRQTLLFNPAGQSPRGGGRRKGNPGELIAMGALNPTRRNVVKQKKKSKAKHHKPSGPRRNPDLLVLASKKPPAKRHPPRRNPDLMGVLNKPLEVLKHGLYATGGMLAARQLPQLLLGTRNQGIVGYVANVVVAIVAGIIASAAFGPAAGGSVMVGGGLYTVIRGLTEQTPLGKHLQLSGVGDPTAAGPLGALVPGYFAHPPVTDRTTGEPVIPEAIIRGVLQRLPAAATATAQGSLTGCRFAQRF